MKACLYRSKEPGSYYNKIQISHYRMSIKFYDKIQKTCDKNIESESASIKFTKVQSSKAALRQICDFVTESRF